MVEEIRTICFHVQEADASWWFPMKNYKQLPLNVYVVGYCSVNGHEFYEKIRYLERKII